MVFVNIPYIITHGPDNWKVQRFSYSKCNNAILLVKDLERMDIVRSIDYESMRIILKN
ncbi:hypothetical protein ACLIKE_04095 [Ferroplasma acidiphilum]|uniref:Uncharacterized protein n=1 Tax=Ferroplasma acidiphilum TaxID=74969 RepID=A0A7K4FNK9_9ARCH|nr:hypothetical protein [Ferroplasma acidiphilum]NOL60610.1 hypothetical protein [Ferroplasma acidiphilum]